MWHYGRRLYNQPSKERNCSGDAATYLNIPKKILWKEKLKRIQTLFFDNIWNHIE